MPNLLPGQPTPDLQLPTVGGDPWQLAAQAPASFTMIVFYRGLHCPICRSNLRALLKYQTAFNDRGVNLIAVSCDDEDRASKSYHDWGLAGLTLAYDMQIEQARDWGLYISTAINDGEPSVFAEPGLFLVRPDQTLYAASIQSMPFTRPGYEDLIAAVDYIAKHNYPARGTLA